MYYPFLLLAIAIAYYVVSMPISLPYFVNRLRYSAIIQDDYPAIALAWIIIATGIVGVIGDLLILRPFFWVLGAWIEAGEKAGKFLAELPY